MKTERGIGIFPFLALFFGVLHILVTRSLPAVTILRSSKQDINMNLIRLKIIYHREANYRNEFRERARHWRSEAFPPLASVRLVAKLSDDELHKLSSCLHKTAETKLNTFGLVKTKPETTYFLIF